MIRPPRLSPGARVAIVAPAGPVPRDKLAAGAEILGERYQLVHDERIFTRTGYLAGSDGERLAELQRALDDPSLAAIFCARGGYGITRVLPGLDGAAFTRAPKPIVGFSDVTALHAWAARLGVASLHAPVLTQLGVVPRADAESLIALLEDPAPPPPLTGLRTLAPGSAGGRLVGGNLEVVSRLVGTPWALALDDTILLLEDVGERPYRIDRALTQLLESGAAARLRGVVVGELLDCVEKDGSGPDAETVIAERFATLGVPVAAGAPIGHGARNRAVPLGARVQLDATAGTLTFADGAVA
jgi:muramoyltetrapeptide carboxypeptidase